MRPHAGAAPREGEGFCCSVLCALRSHAVSDPFPQIMLHPKMQTSRGSGLYAKKRFKKQLSEKPMALPFQDELKEARWLLHAAPQPSGNHAEEVLQKYNIFVIAMAAKFSELRSLLSAMQRVQEAQKGKKKTQGREEAVKTHSVAQRGMPFLCGFPN